jgi:hypothetical protein
MRRDSWRSEPMMCSPPDLLDLDVVAVGVLHRRSASVARRAELDVGAAAGHVRRDRDRARLARPATISASRWWYFALSTLCLSPARWNSARASRRLHARRADEHREPELVQAPRLLDDRVVLLAPRLVDQVLRSSRTIGRLVGITATLEP